MPSPADADTTTRLKSVEEASKDHETRLRARETEGTTSRTQWAMIATLGIFGLGTAGTAGSVLMQDRSRIDVLESRQRELERTSRETQTDQRALATTLSELRTDLRVIGSQITDVRDRAARIEAQLAQSAGSTPTPHR